jgi:hypothetical protein
MRRVSTATRDELIAAIAGRYARGDRVASADPASCPPAYVDAIRDQASRESHQAAGTLLHPRERPGAGDHRHRPNSLKPIPQRLQGGYPFAELAVLLAEPAPMPRPSLRNPSANRCRGVEPSPRRE